MVLIKMRASLLIIVNLMLLLPAARVLAVGDFALLDQAGVFHQLSRYSESDAVVIVSYSNDDETSRNVIPVLRELQSQVTGHSVEIFLLNAENNRAEVLAEVLDADIEFPVLIDSAQVVSRTLQASHTGEIFVLNPDTYRLLFRGIVDGSENNIASLNRLLSAALAGRDFSAELATINPSPTGKLISFREVNQEHQISYSQEIVPLLRRNCTVCHIEEGLAPWAMSSHIMILGWSPMIRETVITRRMPPGQIDTLTGEWQDIHHMSDADQALLLAWIDSGARQDGDHDPLTEVQPDEKLWPLGEPDLIVDVPEEVMPATGIVDFRIKQASLNLKQDKWLQAVAYNVGDRSVLHSLLVYALAIDDEDTAPADLVDADNAHFISLYVPGRTAEVFAEDSAFLLRKGQDLSFKIRYTTSGRETVDRTQIGLYFRDEAPAKLLRTVELVNQDIRIPAQTDNHIETAKSAVTERDLWVESFSPHAHNRAKSMRISVEYPDGSEELLINIANYNFNWQMAYTMKNRKLIPAGSRFVAETVYDNTIANPHNPDPEEVIQWGVSTWDEMFNHFVRVAEPVRH